MKTLFYYAATCMALLASTHTLKAETSKMSFKEQASIHDEENNSSSLDSIKMTEEEQEQTIEILSLYDEIISSYPEDIGLETIFDFNLLNFSQEYFTDKNSLAKRVITDLKNVISLVNTDNIYTYDLNKNCINNIKKIDEILEKFKPEANIISDELFKSQKRAQRAINTLIALGDTSCCEKIKELYTSTDNAILLCECARAAKNLGFKLEKEIGLNKISDKNALELFKSYF